jgi:inorganic triphosphatase YgiF
MARIEWQAPARMVKGQPRLDFKSLADSPLSEVVNDEKSRRALAPVFRTRFKRTTWTLMCGATSVEVALDIGEVLVTQGRKTLRSPISEVELELKTGNPKRLLDLALQLIGKGPNALALVPFSLSKAERGYRLAAGKRPAAVKAAAAGFSALLNEHMSTTAALRAVGRRALELLLANADALRAGGDAECIHQARVALRRFRSAIRLFDRKHEDFPRGLNDELRWLAGALGAARDLDVLTDQMLPPFVEIARASGGSVASEMDALLKDSRERRDAERTAVIAVVSGARYARIVLHLQRWVVSSPPKAETLEAIRARELQQAHRRLFDAARFFSALSAERRHEVRILAKRLRYSLDLLGVGLPAVDVTRFIEQLAELQDELGAINDAAVAASLVAEHSDSVDLVTRARDWFAQSGEGRVRGAEELLLALSEAPRPWRVQRQSPEASA